MGSLEMHARSCRIPRSAGMLGLALTAFLAACATSPLGRSQFKLVSDSQVSKMGIASFAELKKETPASKNSAQVSYVNCVANAITRAVPSMNWNVSVPTSWEVVLFDDDQVNAFAVPGGKIGVYTGLLKVATSQDQLAAVIGHEVAHVLAGHSAERVSQQYAAQAGVTVAQATTGASGQLLSLGAQTFFLLPFSRTHETEADLLGMDLMAKAGFEPSASITLWQNMAKASGGKSPPQMLSTHPSNQSRIRDLGSRLPQATPLYQAARAQGNRPACR